MILSNGVFSEKEFIENLSLDEFYTELHSYKAMKDLEAEEYRKLNEKSGNSSGEGKKRITHSNVKQN